MNKSYSSNWILVVGFLSIITLIVVNYNKETINEYIYKQTNKDNYIIANPNQYFIDSDFKFVKNYTDDVNNREELLNYIYYVINSGETKVNGSCAKEYTHCLNDFKDISNDRELLSNLNNYVHPYNSFKFIVFKSNSYGEFVIEIEHTYSEEMINEIRRSYQMYSRGREQYGRGNYGAKEDTMKSLEYMLQSVVDFITMLKDEAGSQEEFEILSKTQAQGITLGKQILRAETAGISIIALYNIGV